MVRKASLPDAVRPGSAIVECATKPDRLSPSARRMEICPLHATIKQHWINLMMPSSPTHHIPIALDLDNPARRVVGRATSGVRD